MIRTLRAWRRQPDHYYWITALLASRGAEASTTRVVSTLIASLAFLPIIMVFSPAGPQGPVNVGISLTVAAIAIGLALWWRRAHWPSRRQSLWFVTLVSVGVAAVALIQSNPVSGIFATCAFAGISGYLVFFHTARHVSTMMAATVVASAIPAYRLAQAGDPIWAGGMVTAVLVIILTATVGCQAFVEMLGQATMGRDLEPVTGLLNRAAFYEAAGTFIASRSRVDDRHLVILVVSLDNFTLFTPAHATSARVAAGRAMRETTRRDAVVAHITDSEFLVADSFAAPDASALVERIRSAIRSTPLRLTTSIGVVCTPMNGLASCPPYELLDELTALATKVMYDARRAGGNQAQYVVCERPACLDNFPGSAEDVG
ncbi:GGDEF domain-containing protein [[Mycobacterium] wendilense]|uniref:GGDEF domain-containing protein n=1 Tax=[Mycobacterium] wendilense TaxID=3064284 RepID=A0ABM9MC96_9MYCO|nr:GGDEF domain-containing protein [Mycolicibacterium sp. MU0050]CAJ1581715.1 GGDEF domain-containing protein [Mycolicibacterium sp. MU0050]